MYDLNFTPFPELKTIRLHLRALIAEDADAIYDMLTFPENSRFIDRPLISNIEDAKKFITVRNGGVKRNEWVYWAISKRNTKELLGTICLWNFTKSKPESDPPHFLKGDLGYELRPAAQGKGYMHEALKAVLNYGFEALKMDAIEAWTHIENQPSIRLLQKYQFKLKEIIHESHSTKPEGIKMAVYYKNA